MKLTTPKTWLHPALLLTALIVLTVSSGIGGAQQPPSAAQHKPEEDEIGSRLAAMETSIERIVLAISGETRPREKTTMQRVQKQEEILPELSGAKRTLKRLEAVEKSLTNIADFLATGQKPGSNCKLVPVCVYHTCCKWGAPPSDPGTNKCMEPCCGTWETKLVCS
jgi:hypothetical protein